MFSRLTLSRLAFPLSRPGKRQCSPTCNCPIPRFICDSTILKLDSHEKEKRKFTSRIRDLDEFWLRIFEKQKEGVVYEEDLKNVWFLACEEHLPMAIQLTERFLKDQKSSFGSFRFSPIMIRTCFILQKPEMAVEILNNPIISKTLDDATSMITVMDLLIETGHYQDAVNAYERLEKLEWFFILRHPFVPMLYGIALYKQGTPDALVKASKFISNLPLRLKYKQKLEDTVAALAVKMNEPDTAIPLVMKRRSVSEVSWNLLIQAYILKKQLDLVVKEFGSTKFRAFQDTVELIDALSSEHTKNLQVKLRKMRIEDEILAPLKFEDHKDVLVSQKKKFYM